MAKLTKKEIDTKIRDVMEREGWRRENSYIGRLLSKRWEIAYEFFEAEIIKQNSKKNKKELA